MRKNCLIFLILIASCTANRKATTPLPSSDALIGGKLFSALYQQKAAEYRALCFQAYNLARLQLDLHPAAAGNKPLAVITDIDETVLDNSPFAVHQALQGMDYDQAAWYQWTSRASADTVPGAPSFLKYAASRGIAIFYITNRDEKERIATLKNLQHFNLPNADSAHLLLRQSGSGKESRRQQVMNTHDVLLLIGDNLSDFSDLFDKKPADERISMAANMAPEFGKRFIVLPNPGYGDWETSLYRYNYKLTMAQKDSTIRKELKQ